MRIPSVPGFTAPAPESLADWWTRPEATFPEFVWPAAQLTAVHRNPTGWLTVSENTDDDTGRVARQCVLAPAEHAHTVLTRDSNASRDVGRVNVWARSQYGRTFDDGLTVDDEGALLRFFAQIRTPMGSDQPTFDVDHSFLWYFDAFPTVEGYDYLNRSGRPQPLIRLYATDDQSRVDVRALEFRQYLAQRSMSALIDIDFTIETSFVDFERVDATLDAPWARGTFAAFTSDTFGGIERACGWLGGRYIVEGRTNSRGPRWMERQADLDYPEFVYAVDPAEGAQLRHTCDPSLLGSDEDPDPTKLPFLTPVYFRREVLGFYLAEPSRYRVTATQLSCLQLWSLDISVNTVGLVEVYLGELGSRLPSDEWGHWESFNVPPEGAMDPGRFERDFLNRPAASPDVPGALRRARSRLAEAAERRLGAPGWRPLGKRLSEEWEALYGPVVSDAAALAPPILVMSKALVDSIDPAALRVVAGPGEKGEQSLRLLRRLLAQLGDEHDVSEPLRALQAFRSAGGIAHLAGARGPAVAAELGVAGVDAVKDFETVAVRLTDALDTIRDILEGGTAPDSR